MVAKESFASVANVFGIIISATVFGLYLTYAQIPQQITRLILVMDVGAIGFLMIVNVILLIMGMFVDSSAVLMIAVPLLYPVALQLSLIHICPPSRWAARRAARHTPGRPPGRYRSHDFPPRSAPIWRCGAPPSGWRRHSRCPRPAAR